MKDYKEKPPMRSAIKKVFKAGSVIGRIISFVIGLLIIMFWAWLFFKIGTLFGII